MFDIGFSELLLIGVVALVVIGPERLPRVAKTAGILLGRFQRYVATVKTDINRELEELDQLKDLKNLKKEVEQAGGEIETSLRQNMLDAENEAKRIKENVGTNLASATRHLGESPDAGADAPAAPLAPTPQVTSGIPLSQPAAAPPAAAQPDSEQLELALDDSSNSHDPASAQPART
jgi:sec-independent protein translocase protein TatB